MAKRQTIGDNPLDALIPKSPASPDGHKMEAGQDVTTREVAPQQAVPREAVAPVEVARAPDPRGPAPLGPLGGEDAFEDEDFVENQYLTFYLAGEEYAVSILKVREIVEYQSPTPVPTTPSWIRGLMNLRGSVVPVVDLAAKFGLPERAVMRRASIVIVEVEHEGEQTVMGVMVDGVNRVIDLAVEALGPTPAFGTRVRFEFLLGLGMVEEKGILVLDIDRVLSSDEILAVAAAPTAALETADEELASTADKGPGEGDADTEKDAGTEKDDDQ